METNLTKGSPLKLILAFSLPVFLGNLFQIFYNLIDMAIVGRFVSVQALAAVGAVGSVMFCLTGIVTGLANGFGICVARYYGAGEDDTMKRYAAVSVWLCLIVGLMITVIGLLGIDGLLQLMSTPPDIYADARTYLWIIIVGTLITLTYNMLSCLLRAVGDSKTPLYFLIFSSCLNILFDLLAVVLLHMGVAGVAWATVTAQLISAILCFWYIRKHFTILHMEKDQWRFSGKIAVSLLKMGVPMALQFSVCSIGTMIVQAAMNGLGSVAVAAYAVAGKLASFVEQPFVSIGTAMATYVGQNYGAGERKRIHRGVKVGLGLSAVCVIVLFVLSFTIMRPAAELFVGKGETEVIAMAEQYFRIIAWFYPCLGVIFVYRNALQGLGDGFVPMFASVMELAARAGVVAIIGTRYGFSGVIMANPLAWVAAVLPLVPVFYLRMSKFKKVLQ